ncbi:MAG: hypothetical protein RL417_1856 [Pseudomonadota bacterium]|jgi:hypothetical protein
MLEQKSNAIDTVSFSLPRSLSEELDSLGFHNLDEKFDLRSALTSPGSVPAERVAVGEVRVSISESSLQVAANLRGDSPNEKRLSIESTTEPLAEALSPKGIELSFRRYAETVAATVLPEKIREIRVLSTALGFREIAELGDGDSSKTPSIDSILGESGELVLLEALARETMYRTGRIIGKAATAPIDQESSVGRFIRIYIDSDLCRASFTCRDGVREQIAEELFRLGRRGEVHFTPA